MTRSRCIWQEELSRSHFTAVGLIRTVAQYVACACVHAWCRRHHQTTPNNYDEHGNSSITDLTVLLRQTTVPTRTAQLTGQTWSPFCMQIVAGAAWEQICCDDLMAAPVEPDVNPINTARHANIYFTANTTAQNTLCWSGLIVGPLRWKARQHLWRKHGVKKTQCMFSEKQTQKGETFQTYSCISVWIFTSHLATICFTLVRGFANKA